MPQPENPQSPKRKTRQISADIKRYNKIIYIALLVIIGLPLIGSIIFMVPGVQTRIVTNITDRLSNDLNTEISIGSIQALPFSGIRIKDFLVRDVQNDTLLFAPRVHSEIDYFSFFKKHIFLGRITFDSPKLKLKEYEEGMNFTFLLDSLAKNQPDTVKWHYSVRGIDIKNGNLKITNQIFQNEAFKIDSLAFSKLNISATRTSAVSDSIDFELNDLSLVEENGLEITSAGAKGKFRKDKITIRDFFLRTDKSDLSINSFDLAINPEETGPTAEQRFKTDMEKLLISPRELSMYFNNIPVPENPIILSGQVSGSLKSLKGRNFVLSMGRRTRLRTSFDLTDLRNFHETFIFMKIEQLQTTSEDLLQFSKKNKETPAFLKNLGMIHYSGNLTGFFSDMVAFGTFDTEFGSLSTDIGLKYSDQEGISFSGALSTKDFQTGKAFTNKDNPGDLDMNMEINGFWKNKTSYFAYLMGDINSLEWNNYLYQDINVNGLFTYQRFDGSVEMKDPNGIFRFDGEIDASGQTPTFQFRADLENVMPDRLKLLPTLKNAVITLSAAANFKGDNIDNLAGKIDITEGLIYTPKTSLSLDSLSLNAYAVDETKKIELNSDFIEGTISGQYNFEKFRQSFIDMVSHFLPSLTNQKPGKNLPENDFDFEFSFNGFDRAAAILIPGLEAASNGTLKGNVDSKNKILNIDANFQKIGYQGISANDIEFHASTNDERFIEVILRTSRIERENTAALYNFSIHNKAGKDTLDINLFWNNWGEITNSGAIYTTTAFRRDRNKKFYSDIHLSPSTVILQDSVWNISEARALLAPSSFSIQGLEIIHSQQRLALNGFLHKKSMDGMRLEMDNIDLAQLFGPNSQFKHRFGGTADGSVELKNYYRSPLWSANFSIDQFSFNKDTVGFFSIGSRWDPEKEQLAVNTSVQKNGKKPLEGSGYISPGKNKMDIELDLDQFEINFLNTFLGNILQDLDGTASGKLYLAGLLSKPLLTGKVDVDEAKFNVDLLQTSYQLTDSVWFYPNEIRFRDLSITDKNGEKGNFRGSIYHENFADMIYNLQMDVNKMLVLDTELKDNPYYYGTVYANGTLLVTGTTNNIELNIEGETLENTRFFIPMADTEEAVQSNFIQFIGDNTQQQQLVTSAGSEEYKVDLSGLELNMEIDVTPQARIEIIFDSTLGDLLSASGDGNIQIQIDRQGNISFYGDYIIDRGEYLFSLQNLVNKKFDINKGGVVSWQGDPYKARIDLTAVYKVKASLSDLVGPMSNGTSGDEGGSLQRRIPINCNLMLNGPLEKPGIKFGLEAPTLTESRESYMLDFISTEDEMNRQVLSLLVLNRFYTPDYMRMGSDPGLQTNNAALVTTTEMLSNQLSRWLSNISNDLDVGVSYRPEDNISSEEIEVALSTQMFNNRVTINGNVGYGKYQTNTSKMVGDFDMDVKLNPSGTIRAKAYTRSNDDIIYETSPTTQGIGLSFKEEFNKFTDLLLKYWKAITGDQEE